MTEHIDRAIKAGLDAVREQLPDAKIVVLVTDETGDGLGSTGYSGPVEMCASLDEHASTVNRAVTRAEHGYLNRN